MNGSSFSDDDLLLAVRYVLEECPAGEAALFEDRLGEDAAASEALVEAVRLVALLKATPTCPPMVGSAPLTGPATGPSKRPALTWKWGAIAALLAVAVTALWPSRPANVAIIGPSPELVLAWSDLETESTTPDVAEDELTDDEGIADAGDVPDWLLSAVLYQEESSANDGMGFEEESQL